MEEHSRLSRERRGRLPSEAKLLMQTISGRRTVRDFLATPVPDQHIMAILDAARHAPTAGNQQPWRFMIVKDPERLKQLRKEASDWFARRYSLAHRPSAKKLGDVRAKISEALRRALSASVCIVVLADMEVRYPTYAIQDTCLAAENLMIAARALGYGTGFYTTFFPERKMRRFFGIPERYRLVCLTPVGVPKRWPKTPLKKSLKELVLSEESPRKGAREYHSHG